MNETHNYRYAKLTELCLCTNYFIFDNFVHILQNSGLIGLTLMVAILEVFLQHLEDKAIQEALTTNLTPLTYNRYVENSHKRFKYSQMDTTYRIQNKERTSKDRM